MRSSLPFACPQMPSNRWGSGTWIPGFQPLQCKLLGGWRFDWEVQQDFKNLPSPFGGHPCHPKDARVISPTVQWNGANMMLVCLVMLANALRHGFSKPAGNWLSRLSMCLAIDPSTCLSVYLSIHPSIHLSISLSLQDPANGQFFIIFWYCPRVNIL